MTDLNKALKEITLAQGIIAPFPSAGPNNWDEVTCEDFGPEHDYIVDHHGSLVTITPVSEASKQWCYRHLPEDAPRWGIGYAIETNYADDILKGMSRDGLMSEKQYTDAQEEMNAQRLQREE